MYQQMRNQTQAEINATKQKINESKPPEMQRESCKEALRRAKQREQQAQCLLDQAVNAKEAATAEVEKLTRELAAIEVKLGVAGADCLGMLQQGMDKVVQEMSQ